MNTTKKGFVTAASILTIIASAFAIIAALCSMFISSKITEDNILKLYEADPTAEIVQELDGGYKIYITEEDGEVTTIDDETMVVIVDVMKVGCVVIGALGLVLSVAKLILAILLLQANNKDKYRKGIAISLLVLSVLTGAGLETAFIIVSLCLKTEVKKDENAEENNNKEDIVLKDIN